MPPKTYVPKEFAASPFRADDAVAAGVLTRRQLQGAAWVRLFPEVYVHAAVPACPKLWLQAVTISRHADRVARGQLAAWLHGVWTPHAADLRTMRSVTPASAQRMGLKWSAGDVVQRQIAGRLLALTSPTRTCVDLVRAADSLAEAVVWVDAFLACRLVTRSGLTEYADARRAWSGMWRFESALALADGASASPMESRLRMLLVLAGLPRPRVNVNVYDADGSFLGRPDLYYDAPRLGIEYDGVDAHAGVGQRVKDLRRENGLLVAGVPLLRYVSHDVFQRPERIVAEVAQVLGVEACTPLRPPTRRPR